jgi:transposase InsO family protein
MGSRSDRDHAVKLINEACRAGTGKKAACREVGVSLRTYQRWTQGGRLRVDARPTAVRPEPGNKLSAEERSQVLKTCHRPEFASLPPSQIVPRLADEGEYVASESTFYRILREANEQHPRGRARVPQKPRPPASHCAQGPCEVWSWDITWLPGPARGLFFYLYLIIDLYSRKIVGWEVHERECAEYAAGVVRRAVLAEGCIDKPLVLHADNGSPQKGSALRATLEALGVLPSYSRPRVSDDNPFSEAVFRTCKYRPDYPHQGFESLEAARDWVLKFVRWYHHEHRHSGIRYVTPLQRHERRDISLLAQRKAVYEAAKARHPERWARDTRNWEPVGKVWLNPQTDRVPVVDRSLAQAA